MYQFLTSSLDVMRLNCLKILICCSWIIGIALSSIFQEASFRIGVGHAQARSPAVSSILDETNLQRSFFSACHSCRWRSLLVLLSTDRRVKEHIGRRAWIRQPQKKPYLMLKKSSIGCLLAWLGNAFMFMQGKPRHVKGSLFLSEHRHANDNLLQTSGTNSSCSFKAHWTSRKLRSR